MLKALDTYEKFLKHDKDEEDYTPDNEGLTRKREKKTIFIEKLVFYSCTM